MRTVGVRALRNLVVFVPIGAAEVPVCEPFLFGLQILHLEVEDTVVCDEGFEAPLMMAGYPIDAESAEGRADAAQMVFVHVRLFAELINRREIVAHTLTAVVTRDCFVPFLAEARQTATIRGYDDIITRRHHHEVPSEGPELRNGTLRTSLAIQNGRVFLVRIEMRRIDDPCQHVLAIRGLLPARHYRGALDLVVDIVVLVRQLGQLNIAVHFRQRLIHIKHTYLVGLTHRVFEQVGIMVRDISQTYVKLTFGHLRTPAFETHCP